MARHARLSASGSKQWINCPGSVRKENDLPAGNGGSSVFAMQGTAAHYVADYCLTHGVDATDCVGNRVWVYDGNDDTKQDCYAIPAKQKVGGRLEKRLEKEGYRMFTVVDGEGNGEVDEVKAWGVDMFVGKVRREFEEYADQLLTTTPLSTEMYMDGSWLHPLLGGTADANFLDGGNWVRLYDLKFGAGVSVEVEDNTQLMIYAVFILHILRQQGHSPNGVILTIVQPRLSHVDGPIRSKTYTAEELDQFRDELKELAENTQKRNAPVNAGDWCLWCRAKIGCDAFRERTLELAGLDFNDDPPDVPSVQVPKDNTELARLASWIPMLDVLAKEVEGAIARELHQGRPVPGFKVVRKRTNRRFGRPDGNELTDGEIVKHMLGEALVAEEDLFHPRELLSLAQMEKLGKDAKRALVAITFKPEGALTVAPDSDTREAVAVEVAAFPDDLGDIGL